jgi:hypothetical protein
VYFESLSVESVAWSGIDTYKPSAGPATALHATDDGTRFPVEPEPPSVQAPTTKSRIPASATRNIEVDILHNQSFREQKKKKKKKKTLQQPAAIKQCNEANENKADCKTNTNIQYNNAQKVYS